MELQALILSVLLLLIVSGVEPKSVSTQCAVECTEKNFFEYQEGYDYIYSYDADIISGFHKTTDLDQRTHLAIKSRPRIRVRSKCELELSFDNIQILNQETNSADDWARAITRNNLRFSWQDGSIPSICSEEEETWVLNFKRGFLSTLQTSSVKNESSVQEIDVSGECEASYISNRNSRGNHVITKRKDYSKCTDRDKHMMFSYFTPFTSESPRQNFIYSEQSCENEIENGVIQNIDCSESHVLRPFSSDESGARTKIEQRVRYLQRQRSPFDATRYTSLVQRGMKYEEIEMTDSEENYYNQAMALLSDICTTYESEHYDMITSHFTTLVNLLGKLDHHHIEELYQLTNTMACDGNEQVLREMIIDAVPFCYTEGCVMFGTDLIRENTLSESISKRWLVGFSFTKQATAGMVDSLMSIISEPNVPRSVKHQAYLTSGALINSVCTAVGHDECARISSIKNAVNKLVEKLGSNCRTPNPETIEEIISALRGLGNAGVSNYISAVNMCIEEIDNPMEVRIAAVQTYRRKPCNADRSVLEDIFFNSKEDSEIRISAYLGLMQCPTDKRIRNIVSALEVENSQQVASFVWSHMNELQSSTDPLKFYIQQFIKDADIKAFELDPTKFSRFYEDSVFSEQLNAGATVDSNIVWSPKSFIPRSAMVNLTLDVFGQAVNLFEIGGRIEGVEGLLQQFLEPEIAEKKLNRRRVVDNSIAEIDRQYKDKVTNERNAMGSGYLRVFGNELAYMRSDFRQHMQATNDNQWLRDFAAKAMTHNGYSYHDDSILLNSVHKIPTGVGFPMTVAFNGSTSVDMTAKGNFQLPREGGVDISGRFNPRAAVVIRSAMTIDAHVTEYGISTESVAMTSSQISVSLNIDSDKNLEFSVDTPYSKNTILEIKHTLLAVRNGEVSEMRSSSPYASRPQASASCTNDYAGQRLCYYSSYNKEMSFSAKNAMATPLFPMDGRYEMSLEVQKTDQSLRYYLLTAQSTIAEEEGSIIPPAAQFKIVMDTPQTTVNRRTTLDLSYSIPNQEFFAEAQRFGVQYNAQGSIRNTDAGKEINLALLTGEDQYSVNSIYKKDASGVRREWSLLTSVITPEKNIQSTGELIFEPGTQATFDFEIINLNEDPIQIKLDLQDKTKSQNKLEYSGEGVLKLMPFVNTGFDLGMTLRPKINNLFLDLQYSFDSGRRQSIILNHKRKDRGTATTTNWQIAHKFTSTQFGFLNHDIKIGQTSKPTLVESNIEISYGINYDAKNNKQKLQMSQSMKDLSSNDELRYDANWQLNVPYTQIDHEMGFVFANSEELLNAKLSLNPQSRNGHVLEVSVEDHSRSTQSFNKRLFLSVPTPWGNLNWDNHVLESPENVYTMQSSTSMGESSGLSFTGETTLQLLDSVKGLRTEIKDQDGRVVLEASSENRYSLSPLTVSTNNVFNVGDYVNSFDMTINEQQTGYETESILKNSLRSKPQQKTYRIHAASTKTETGRYNKLILQNTDTNGPDTHIVAETGCGVVRDAVSSAYASVTKNDRSLFDARYNIKGQIIEPAFGSTSVSISIAPITFNHAFNGAFDTRNGIQANGDYNWGGMQVFAGFELPVSMDSIDVNVRHNIAPERNNIEIKLAKIDNRSASMTYIEKGFSENSAPVFTSKSIGRLGDSKVTLQSTCTKGNEAEHRCMEASLIWGTFPNKGIGAALNINNIDTEEHMQIEHYYDNQLRPNTDMYYALRQIIDVQCQRMEMDHHYNTELEFKKMGTSVSLKEVTNGEGIYATGTLSGKELSIAITNNCSDSVALGVPSSANAIMSVSDNIYGRQSVRFFVPNAEISLNANHQLDGKSLTSTIEFANTFVGLVDLGAPNHVTVNLNGNGEVPHSSVFRLDMTTGRQTQSSSIAIEIDRQASSINFNHNVPAMRAIPQSVAAEYSYSPYRLQGRFSLGRKQVSIDGTRGKGRVFATLTNSNMIESLPSSVRSDVRYSTDDNTYKFDSLTTLDNSKNYKLNLFFSHAIEEDSIAIKANVETAFDSKILNADASLFNSAEKFSIDISREQNILSQYPRLISGSLAVLMGEEKGIVVSYSLNGRKARTLDLRHSSEEGTVFGNVSFRHNNEDLPLPRNFRLKMVTENQDNQKTVRAIMTQPQMSDKTIEVTFSGPMITRNSAYFSASLNHDFDEIMDIRIPRRASVSTLYSNNRKEIEVTFSHTLNDASFNFDFNFNKARKSARLTVHNNGMEQLYTFDIRHNLSPSQAELYGVLSLGGEEHVVYLSAALPTKFRMEGMKIYGEGSFDSLVRIAGKQVSFNISGNFNDRIWKVEEKFDENVTPYGLKGIKTVSIERTVDFDYTINFGDDGSLVISFDTPTTEDAFTCGLTLDHSIPQLMKYIPSHFDEKLALTTEGNESILTLSFETTDIPRKTHVLTYDFNEPLTRSSIEFTHDCEMMEEYGIPRRVGFEFTQQMQNKRSNGQLTYNMQDNHATVEWRMPSRKQVKLSMSQTFDENIPSAGGATVALLENGVEVTIDGPDNTAMTIELLKESQQAYHMTMNQNMIETMPFLKVNAGYSTSSVSLSVRLDQRNTHPTFNFIADYESGNSRAYTELSQTYSAEYPSRCSMVGILDIAEKHGSIEAACDDTNVKLSAEVTPDRYIINMKQNACEKMPANSEISFAYNLGETNTFEIKAIVDSKTYQYNAQCSMGESSGKCDMQLLWDKSSWQQGMAFEYATNQLTWTYHLKQDLVTKIPAAANLKEIFTWREDAKSFTFHLDYTNGEPIDFTWSWNRNDESVFGDISISQNAIHMSTVPTEMSISMDRIKKGRIAFRGSINGQNVEFVALALPDSISFTHNFDMLTEMLNIPQDINLSVNMNADAGSIAFVFGEKQAEFAYTITSAPKKVEITLTQSFMANQPQTVAVMTTYEWEKNDNTFLLSGTIQGTVDENVYKIDGSIDHKVGECVSQIALTTPRQQLAADATLNREEKTFTYNHNQNMFDCCPREMHVSIGGDKQDNKITLGGSFSTDRISLVKLDLTFRQPSKNSAEMTVSHNQRSWTDYVGHNSVFTITWTASPADSSVELKSVMDGNTQAMKVRITNMPDEYAITMNHNVGILETYNVPTSFKESLSGVTGNHKVFTFAYTINNREKSFVADFSKNAQGTASVSVDQNIYRYVSLFGTKFITPKKVTVQFETLEDQTYRISSMVKAKGRQTAELVYRIVCDKSSQDISFVFTHDMDDIVPSMIPNSAKFTFLRNEENPLTIHLSYDADTYDLTVDYQTTNPYTVSVTFDQNSPLSELISMPRHTMVSESFTLGADITLTGRLELDDQHYQTTISGRVAGDSIVSSIVYTGPQNANVNANLVLSKLNGNYSISASGNYRLPNQNSKPFMMGMSGKYERDTRMVLFNMFHNIPELKQNLIPYAIDFKQGGNVDLPTKTLTFEYKITLDDLYHDEETFSGKITGNSFVFSGTSSTVSTMMSLGNQVYQYTGAASYDLEDNHFAVSWKLNGQVGEQRTDMLMSADVTYNQQTFTITGISEFQPFNELGVPRKVVYSQTLRRGSFREELRFTNGDGNDERMTGVVTWRPISAEVRLTSTIRSWEMPFRSVIAQFAYSAENNGINTGVTVDGNNFVSLETTTTFNFESMPKSIKHSGVVMYTDSELYSGSFDFAQNNVDDISIDATLKIKERKTVFSHTTTKSSGVTTHKGSYTYSDGQRNIIASEHSTSYRFGRTNLIKHSSSATYKSDEVYSGAFLFKQPKPSDNVISLSIQVLERKFIYDESTTVSNDATQQHMSYSYSDASQTYLSYSKSSIVDISVFRMQLTERWMNQIIPFAPRVYECNLQIHKDLANIHYRWSDKTVDFVYNENGNGEYTLRHNIAYARNTMKIPTVISGVYQMGDDNLTFNIVFDPYKFNFAYNNKAYHTQVYYAGNTIFTLEGSYAMNSDEAMTSHEIVIPIMRLHYNVALSAQGDVALNEKSVVKFVLTDKSLRNRRSMEIEASGRAGETPMGSFSMVSDLERINAIDFGMDYKSHDFDIHYDDYLLHFNGTYRKFLAEISLPENMDVYQASFASGCEGDIENEFKSYATFKWNQANIIRFTANVTSEEEEEKEIDLSFEHPFEGCANSIVITHHGHSTARAKSYHTHVIVDGQDTHISSSYRGTLPNLSGSHNLKVEIAHPYEGTYVPNQFVTTGKMSIFEGLYDSKWTISADGEDKVILNKVYQKTRDGATFTFEWKQPFEGLIVKEMSMDYSYSPTIPVTLTIDLLHNKPCKYIPSQTKNIISIALQENDYRSSWSMLSEDTELASLLNHWLINQDGVTANIEFRQPHDELLLTKFNFNMEATARDEYQLFTTHTEVNEHVPVKTRFENVINSRDSGVSANTESSVTVGDDVYSFVTEQSWGASPANGYKYHYNSDVNLPQDTQILSVTIPAIHKFRNSAFWRNQNAHLRSTYETSSMEAPVGVDLMYRNTEDEMQAAFTGNFSLTNEPTDLYHKLTIEHLRKGKDIKFVSKSPLIELDNMVVRFKYNKNGKSLLSIDNGVDEPVEIRGNFKEVISALKNYARRSTLRNLTPSLRFFYDQVSIQNGKDSFIGFEVNGVTYAIHALTFTENGERAVLQLQSRKGEEVTEIAHITAHLENENTLRLTATANNFISAFSRALLHVAGEEVTIKVTDAVEDVIDLLKAFKNSLEGNHKVVDTVHENIDSAIEKMSTIQREYRHFINDLNEYTVQSLEESEDKVAQSIRRCISMVAYIRQQIQEVVLGPIKDITHDYYMEAAEQFTIKLKRELLPVKRVFDMINAGDLLMELVEEGVLKTMYFIEKNVEASLAGVEPAIAHLVDVTDTSVILDIPLSIQIELVPLPSYTDVLMWVAQSSFSSEIDLSIQKLYSLTDDYYKLRSFIYKPLDELIPPYKGHAEVTDFKHFRTFDGLQYEFDSSCASSHVLARDFRDGDFTVLMKYGSGNPSIGVRTALSDGTMQYIEMRQDYSIVNEDGNAVELPISYEGLTVKRTGDFVRLSTDTGLAVTCNFKNSLCHIDISAFYFGSTAGLAGTFNNEIYDDFTLPSESISSEVEELAVSWTVPGETCRVTNTYTSCQESYNEECEALFTDKSSILRSCFPVVDPTPYLEMCKKDTCSDNAASTCASVATYQRRCMLSGAPLVLPSQCITCDSADGNAVGVNAVRKTVTSADVVFVVEKSACMNLRKLRGRELLDNIHEAIESSVGSVRYAVVGFGSEPVSHTFNGALFKEARTEVHASHTHSFSNRDILSALSKTGIDGGDQTDVLSAISAATQLPFQAGASRTIILFTCDECSPDSVVNTDLVKSQLKEQNIVMHHFRNQKIVSGKKKAYGFNNERVFSKTPIDREDIKTSKDVCRELASLTNGSVWNQRMFARRSVKDLFNTVGGEVSRGTQLKSSHICKCVNGPNGPVSVCSA